MGKTYTSITRHGNAQERRAFALGEDEARRGAIAAGRRSVDTAVAPAPIARLRFPEYVPQWYAQEGFHRQGGKVGAVRNIVGIILHDASTPRKVPRRNDASVLCIRSP
jgi:hypothetical protein